AAESFIQGNALAFEARRLKPEELSQTAPQLLPGQSVGAYKILALLGRGGMGVGYRAGDERLRRDVGVKRVPASCAPDSARLRRFEQEARATSALNHPNIITIYEIGEAATERGDIHFIATEFIEGQTVRQQIAGGRLKLGTALDVATQVASALAAAHAA